MTTRADHRVTIGYNQRSICLDGAEKHHDMIKILVSEKVCAALRNLPSSEFRIGFYPLGLIRRTEGRQKN